jgi:hypothetical protein
VPVGDRGEQVRVPQQRRRHDARPVLSHDITDGRRAPGPFVTDDFLAARDPAGA